MHTFKNDEKITALQRWLEGIELHITTVRDALGEAETLDRYGDSVPQVVRDEATDRAISKADTLAKIAPLLNPVTLMRVSPQRYDEAMKIAIDVAGDDNIRWTDEQTSFYVRPWTTPRIHAALMKAKIIVSFKPAQS